VKFWGQQQGETKMDVQGIHPVALRAIEFKYGEAKLSKTEEKQLAIDFYAMCAEGEPPTFASTLVLAITSNGPSPVEIGEQPISIIDGILRIVADKPVTADAVYAQFEARGWARDNKPSIVSGLYAASDPKSAVQVLRRVGEGLFVRVGAALSGPPSGPIGSPPSTPSPGASGARQIYSEEALRKPSSLIEGVCRVIDRFTMSPTEMYREFQMRGWSGSVGGLQEVMRFAASPVTPIKKRVLRKVGRGLYAKR
jgi:hypothetical protein